MSSDKSIVDLLKPVKKRNSPDIFYNNEDNKRIKYEIGESSYTTPDILIDVQDDELLRKYQNISTRELENLCERLMYYDSTGIYIPPKDFNKKCENHKKKNDTRSKLLTEETVTFTEKKTTFGSGSIGVASNFGDKQCSCCNNSFIDPRSHYLPTNNYQQPGFSGNFNFTDMAAIPSTSGLSRSSEPFIDNISFLNQTSNEIDELSEILNHNSALDLSINNESVKNEICASDSSNTIYYSDDSQAIFNNGPNLPQDIDIPLNLSNVSVHSEIEPIANVSQEENSVVTILDVTENPQLNRTPQTNNEVVDLTNVFVTPRQPINSNEIIELLDDTFQTNLTPGVVETIDLIDSDSDEDVNISTNTSEKSLVEGSKSFECPICFDPLKNKKIMTTICGHIFCSKCISNAIKSKKCCPTCRKKLKPHHIHPIYLNL